MITSFQLANHLLSHTRSVPGSALLAAFSLNWLNEASATGATPNVEIIGLRIPFQIGEAQMWSVVFEFLLAKARSASWDCAFGRQSASGLNLPAYWGLGCCATMLRAALAQARCLDPRYSSSGQVCGHTRMLTTRSLVANRQVVATQLSSQARVTAPLHCYCCQG